MHLALLRGQRPVLGLVLLPELQQLWVVSLLADASEAWWESPD